MKSLHQIPAFSSAPPEAEQELRDILEKHHGLMKCEPLLIDDEGIPERITICPHDGGFLINGSMAYDETGEPITRLEKLRLHPARGTEAD